MTSSQVSNYPRKRLPLASEQAFGSCQKRKFESRVFCAYASRSVRMSFVKMSVFDWIPWKRDAPGPSANSGTMMPE